MKHLGVLTLALSTLLACGDDGSPPGDGGGADAPPEVCEATFDFEIGDPEGHAEPLGASAGEARAGRLETAELPPDPDGLSLVRAGDFVLANDRIAVVIEDMGDSDVLDPWGGKLVNVARMRDGAMVEPADFNEMIPLIHRFTLEPRSVGVLSDGSDGGAAVVRAVGQLAAAPFFDPLARTILPDELGDIEAALDWILEPDADQVEMVFTFASTRSHRTPIRIPLLFIFQTMRMPQWLPGVGFGSAVDPTPYVAYIEEGAASFAWEDPEEDLSPFLELSGSSIFQGRPFDIGACAETRHDFARLHMGGPGLDGLAQVLASARGETLRTITGTVTEADGSPASGVRVHAETADGVHLTRALTDETGAFAVHVPEVEVRLTAYRRGDTLGGPVAVGPAVATADIALAATAEVHVVARDAVTAEPLPARVQIIPEGDLPAAPEQFGEAAIVPGRLHVAFPPDGDVTLRVPPGRHTVAVSRGYEYELVTEVVDLAAGETATVTADLQRSVDTTGIMCGDFHIHTHRSFDTADHARLKVASIVADGVEIPVRSDHEWIGDFEPLLSDMGLEAWAYGISSLELTSFDWGHFGVFPLDADATRANGGAPRWFGQTTPEVFAEVRSRSGTHGAPVIIINHPRTFGGLMGEGAYFQRVGYDPLTGTVAHEELWDEGFGLVEVFNDSTFDDNLETVADWFSFLNGGRRVFAVGSSDSHQIAKTPVGYPRTCVTLGVDDAAALRALGAGAVRDALSAGHAFVSGGVFLEAVGAGDAGPGDEVTGAAARETVAVTVRAASWVDVDSLRVYVDGALTETLPIDEGTADPMDATVRLRADVEVPVASGPLGSWVVFVAAGDTPLDPVSRGRMPFAVTNPIFLTR